MIHEENTTVNLELEKDLIFKCSLGLEKLKEIYIDETLKKKENPWGPDAAKLLGMAILGCLSASFIFCLNKRNLTPDDLQAHAEISFKKIEKGYERIKKIDVKLMPKTDNPATLKRINQCIRELKSGKSLFEETCIITASIREGIKINVDVKV